MLKKIFPYRVQLTILQLEWYHLGRFLVWVGQHYWLRSLEGKKVLLLNAKAKVVLASAVATAIIFILLLTYEYKLIGFLLGILLATQSYIYLTLITLVLKPFEIARANRLKNAASERLMVMPHLKVIGIAGSFAKTSTKVFLYEMLRKSHTSLKTPGNYNTPLGIAKVIEWELYPEYDYFIYEGGAFWPGDVAELAEMLRPSLAMVTGLNEQHLERFGTLAKAVATELELADYAQNNNVPLFANHEDPLIQQYLPAHAKEVIWYGSEDDAYKVLDLRLTDQGSIFTLVLGGKGYPVQTPLLGRGQITNILAAATVAHYLGVSVPGILETIRTLKPVPHRLERRELPGLGVTLIDNAYNSNTNGFRQSLEVLGQFKGRSKVLVTPGIVELGKETWPIHEELGKKAGYMCEYIFLVGKSERTEALAAGIENKDKIIWLNSIQELWPTIKQMTLKDPVVLLENDLPDNY